MGLTDFTRYSNNPVDDAMQGIYDRRLRELVSKKIFGSHYDPEVKPASIGSVLRYLKLIGREGWDCDCGSWKDDRRLHSETCSVTPEFAKLVSKLGQPSVLNTGIKFTFWYLVWDTWDENKKAIREMIDPPVMEAF